ncbi:septation protein SepH [Corynebacterium lubricantis]|uniref:septation protein SepH n=1 Tax=Corynebacterium lubricantis TaxID=541095 RepID=UPI00035E0493|nr:septation protein SepH [Corynebacterium lubricantis]
MRELFPVDEESTEQSLVLRTEDGELFSLSRRFLADSNDATPGTPVAPVAPVTAVTSAATDEDSPENGEQLEPANPQAGESTPDSTSASSESEVAKESEAGRSLPQPDPLYATPFSMRPSEIQQRIRAGATTQELAEEMGVAESRLEAYAHPVLLEREQVAQAAKQSRPVREDGPAKLTLFEILATAFAARGHSLSEASWDAVREPGDAWVVRVSWKAGLSDNVAEWSFKRSGLSATTEARNPIAADLTDPNFVQPVRSLTAVSTGSSRPVSPSDDTSDLELDADFSDDLEADQLPEGKDDRGDSGPETSEEVFAEGEFLQNPESDQAPQKRKRKAVTPHWEDVLLGVRTNQKRPRK